MKGEDCTVPGMVVGGKERTRQESLGVVWRRGALHPRMITDLREWVCAVTGAGGKIVALERGVSESREKAAPAERWRGLGGNHVVGTENHL